MDALFRLENVQFKNIIHYPDFSIEEGKVTFVIGKSGSGKSTLLSLLNKSKNCEEGQIYYKDKVLSEYDSLSLRKEVLVVSQHAYLFNTTIEENFKKFYQYREEQVCTKEQIENLLKVCNLDFALDQDVTNMSGGEKQRLYLAIFLSFLPNVLLLDEPTSALDQKNAKIMLDNVIAFCKERKITLVIISHDEKLVDRYHENVISLDKEEDK